jgi:UDP-GlcNAc:undecaprenyl-phosphate GlcNAc-1-phosphate transferase
MLVGLLLGAIGLRSSLKEATAFSVLVPVAVLSLPLFDSAMAIIRRKLTGRSIFTGDRGHIHHNLMRVGFSNRAMILLVTLMGGLVAMAACLGVVLGNDFIPVVAMAAILSCLIFARWFGYVELRLLVNKLKHLLERFLPQGWISPNAPHQAMVILQGHRNWDRIWKSLVELALQRQLLKVCMDVNVPWLHEGFHANWERASELPADQRWGTRFPIIAQGRLVGRLEVSGALDDSSYLMTLGMLGGLLQNLAPQIEALVNEGSVAVRTDPPGEPVHSDVVASGPLI